MKLTPQERAKDRRLRKLFRITLAEHGKILRYQQSHPVYYLLLGNHLGLDHRHADGKVRGLLEWRINRAYGLLEKVAGDNLSAVLRALAAYHETHPAEAALGRKVYGLIGQAKVKRRMIYGPPKQEPT